MDHPFVDTSELTDDELQSRIEKCQGYLYGEIQSGHAGMVDTIRAQLQAYEFEREERMLKKRADMIEKKSPSGIIEIGTIETLETPDPDADMDLKVKRQKDL